MEHYDELDRYPINDYEAIKWVEENIDEEIKILFNNYYKECCSNLNSLKIKIPEEEKINNIKHNLKNVINIPNFIEEYCDLISPNKQIKETMLSNIKDLIKKIGSNEKLEYNEKILLIKMWRYYNMFLKYGHSAKATWVANNIINKVIKNVKEKGLKINEDDERILKKIVITSAFLHDIGRFYQALHYDTLDDNVMAIGEEEDISKFLEDIKFKHSEAGYYYSVASSFMMNNIDINDKRKKEDFIIQTISALIIRFHSLSNEQLEHFASDNLITSIRNNNINDKVRICDSLYDFIYNSYKDMGYTDEEKNRYAILLPKNFKKFVDDIIKQTEQLFLVDSGFKIKPEILNMNYKLRIAIKNILEESLFNNKNKDNLSCIAQKIAVEIKKFIKNKDNKNRLKVDESKLKKDIEDILKNSMDYDIARVIDKKYKNKDDKDVLKMSPLAKYAIHSSMSIVTDADKIDIFDQRAKGIYNVPYKMDKIYIYPPKNTTFTNILKDYFKFDLNFKEYDEKVIKFVNQKNVMNIILIFLMKVLNTKRDENELNNIYENINSEQIKNDNKIKITKIIFENNKGKIIFSNNYKIENVNIYKMFNEYSWDDVSLLSVFLNREKRKEKNVLTKVVKNNDTGKLEKKETPVTQTLIGLRQGDPSLYSEIKHEYKDDVKLSISREMFKDNIKHFSNEEQTNYFRKLVIGESRLHDKCDEVTTLVGRFKLCQNNPIGTWTNFLVKEGDEHIIPSSLVGLIWQLNQFILVNMRSKYSMELIISEGILDKIYEQYRLKDAFYEASIIYEFIYYAKEFINYVLDYCNKNDIDLLTPQILAECRNGFESYYRDTVNLDSINNASSFKI